MTGSEQIASKNGCAEFLQWALPLLHLRWKGFRRVRAQVCNRLRQRLQSLGIASHDEYRRHLLATPQEWTTLDRLCRITISRFYRDRMVFRFLVAEILPPLLLRLVGEGKPRLRLWSAGCAGGEEPYTLGIVWEQEFAGRFPDLELEILATDIDPAVLDRARAARYSFSSVKGLPETWRQQAFIRCNNWYCLKERYRRGIRFALHDIRDTLEAEPFHLVLCRNLAFTYYDEPLRQEVLDSIWRHLQPGGFLIVGVHETVADRYGRFAAVSEKLGIYQRQ